MSKLRLKLRKKVVAHPARFMYCYIETSATSPNRFHDFAVALLEFFLDGKRRTVHSFIKI